jgi:RimJ/RimL family protein N-acetyltransferase
LERSWRRRSRQPSHNHALTSRPDRYPLRLTQRVFKGCPLAQGPARAKKAVMRMPEIPSPVGDAFGGHGCVTPAGAGSCARSNLPAGQLRTVQLASTVRSTTTCPERLAPTREVRRLDTNPVDLPAGRGSRGLDPEADSTPRAGASDPLDTTTLGWARDCPPLPTHLPDGTPVVLRPLLPEDKYAFAVAVSALSVESRRRRFFSPSQPNPAILDYLVDIDYMNHFAWIVLDGNPPHPGLGTGRYVREHDDPDTAEVAFGVTDPLQGRGIGTLLFGAVGVAAAEVGIRRLVGHVLVENAPMHAVFAKAGIESIVTRLGVSKIAVAAEAAAGLLETGLREQVRRMCTTS